MDRKQSSEAELKDAMTAPDEIAAKREELADAIQAEHTRQEEHIELIASENYASPRVMEAQGSVLTNKYAEGYPSKRYYGGCEYVDRAEDLARERLKELYGKKHSFRLESTDPHGLTINIRIPREVATGRD